MTLSERLQEAADALLEAKATIDGRTAETGGGGGYAAALVVLVLVAGAIFFTMGGGR